MKTTSPPAFELGFTAWMIIAMVLLVTVGMMLFYLA
jgi:hypothetical protein